MNQEDKEHVNKFLSLLATIQDSVTNLEAHIFSVEKQLAEFMAKCEYKPTVDDQWTESRLRYLEMRERQIRKILKIGAESVG